MPNEAAQARPDDAQLLFSNFVQLMSTLTAQTTALSASMASTGKAFNLFSAKLEDFMAAIDDHRAATDELTDTMGELSGYVGSSLRIVDELAEKGAEAEVKWSDVKEIIAKLKEEAAKEDDEEEEDEQ